MSWWGIRPTSQSKIVTSIRPTAIASRAAIGQYSLVVPFTERFFDLALYGADVKPAGYIGMITANSFMKREFGKKLIEEFFPRVDLTHVIDTSGAYIPGHGTPTVILLGRHRPPVSQRCVRCSASVVNQTRLIIRPKARCGGQLRIWIRTVLKTNMSA